MAARIASRYLVRRLSSSGKVLGEEEKAAENVYIKKVEQEKQEKLARKLQGSKPEDHQASQTTSTADVKGGGPLPSSTNQNRNYAVIGGTIVALSAALGWYLLSKPKKTEEVSK